MQSNGEGQFMDRPYFMISVNLICTTTIYDVYFNVNNVSDHLLIQLILKLDMPQLVTTVAKSSKPMCWSNANDTVKQ